MSDPQEAATPSDPHSAEARAKYPDDYNGWSPQGIVIPSLREGFDAGRVSRDAEVAELKAKIAELQSRPGVIAERPAIYSEIADENAEYDAAWQARDWDEVRRIQDERAERLRGGN